MKSTPYILITIFVLGCNSSPKSEIEVFKRDKVTEEVLAMLNAYFKDMKEEGFSAEFKYLDNSEDFFWVPPGFNSAIDYDSVKVILEGNQDAFSSIEFRWDTLKIIPLTNYLANYTGVVGGNMYTIDGDTIPVHMIETGTLIKRSDGWKILNGQSRVQDIEE